MTICTDIRLLVLLLSVLTALPVSSAEAQCETEVLDGPLAFHGLAIDFWNDTLVYSRTLGLDFPVDVAIAERDGFDWPVVDTVGPEPYECQTTYGIEVAIEGEWLAVADTRTDCLLGRVYMYRQQSDGSWASHGTLEHPGEVDIGEDEPITIAQFARKIVIQDDLAVVAVHTQGVGNMSQVGIVFLYRFNGTEWEQEGYILSPDPVQDGNFGFSVAIDGDVLVIGAIGNTGFLKGTVYIYRLIGEEWTLEAKFLAPIQNFQTSFGLFVDIVGDRVIAAAPNGQNGRVYVIEHDGETWEIVATIVPENLAPGTNQARFGHVATLTPDGQTLLITARWDQVGGSTHGGSAFVYRHIDGEWVEIKKIIPSVPTDTFGWRAAVNDDWAAIHAGYSGQMFTYAGLSGTDCNNSGTPDACDIFHGDSLDMNNNGIPDECEADLNGDGVVDVDDLFILLAAWGACPDPDDCPADFHGNGVVDVDDLFILLASWG